MSTRRMILGLSVLVLGSAVLAVFCLGKSGDETLRDPTQRALYVLSHPRWYESVTLWKARGWSGDEPPKLAPSAVRGQEVSELLALIGFVSDAAEMRAHLEEYVNHENTDVARLAIRELVRRGDWNLNRARRFARKRGLPIDSHQALNSARHVEPQRGKATEPSDQEKVDQLDEALRVLDNPKWYEHDSEIGRIRAAQERNTPGKRTPISAYVRDREDLAVATLLAASLSQEKKQALLTQYLDHDNEAVAQRCFAELIRSGMWAPTRGIAFTRQNNPTVAGWHSLLHCLPEGTLAKTRRTIARELLSTTDDDRQRQVGSSPSAEVDAAQALLGTQNEGDFDLIRSAVQHYPDEVRLWQVASRLPFDLDFARFAELVCSDEHRSRPVRCAAALSTNRDIERVAEENLNYLLVALRSFADKGVPPPAGKTDYVRRNEANDFLAIAYEIPPALLSTNVSQLARYSHGSLGRGVSMILACRDPVGFVATVADMDSISESFYAPLFVAATYEPKVVDVVRRLIPAKAYDDLEATVAKYGIKVLVPVQFTIWE